MLEFDLTIGIHVQLGSVGSREKLFSISGCFSRWANQLLMPWATQPQSVNQVDFRHTIDRKALAQSRNQGKFLI